jgi:hypothetical protein
LADHDTGALGNSLLGIAASGRRRLSASNEALEEGEAMRGFLAVLTVVSALAAALATGSGAVATAPTGDTCTVNGSGTAYTITIMLPANAPEQGAFAVRSVGHTIVNLDVASNTGKLSKSSGPNGQMSAWVLDNSAVPGATVSAAVTTDKALTGTSTFIVTPGSFDHSSWYDSILCQFPKGAPVPSNAFTAQKKAIYNAGSGTWREAVTLPGPGKVIFAHRTIAAGGTPKPLIKAGAISVSKAGQAMLTLKPTPAGMAALSSTGAIKLSLNIEYSPKNGKPANKAIVLTLRK